MITDPHAAVREDAFFVQKKISLHIYAVWFCPALSIAVINSSLQISFIGI